MPATCVRVELDAELARGLKALSQRHGATLFMTLAAGWAAVLSRLSGQPEVVIGTPVAEPHAGGVGRADRVLREHAGAAGGGLGHGVAELLEQVKGRALDAQEHQDLPFEQVVELVKSAATSRSHAPSSR